MAEHTPTPWKVEENCLGVYPISAKHGPLAVQPAKAFGEGDAAFIVKAVNNHNALVFALTELCQSFEFCVGKDTPVVVEAQRVLAAVQENV